MAADKPAAKLKCLITLRRVKFMTRNMQKFDGGVTPGNSAGRPDLICSRFWKLRA
jgi:hypothetical protein